MPLYDCVLLLKPQVKTEVMIELAARIGKHISRRNGVVTEMKSFGEVQLGYGIKKIGQPRYFQGKLMQMTMMATPNINKELHYLNKEDTLLRWLLVKHRDVKLGLDSFDDDDYDDSSSTSPLGSLFAQVSDEDDIKDDDDSTEEEEEEEEQEEE